MLIKNSYCWKCRRETHFIGKNVNQLGWFLITLLTGGFGAMLWIAVNLSKGWKCNTCGQKEAK